MVNVVLNLFFVIVLHMDVAGVATATVISQAISAGLVVWCLVKVKGDYNLDLKKLRIYKDKLLGMTKIGLPAGIQGASFAISNVLIQSSINSFGAVAMAGNTAASNIEGFVSTAMDAFSQAALSFTAQNLGAGKTKRLSRILWLCLSLVAGTGLLLGVGGYLLAPQLLGICGFRIVWILTVFAALPTLGVLYASYPITWGLAAVLEALCYLVVKRRVVRKRQAAAAGIK